MNRTTCYCQLKPTPHIVAFSTYYNHKNKCIQRGLQFDPLLDLDTDSESDSKDPNSEFYSSSDLDMSGSDTYGTNIQHRQDSDAFDPVETGFGPHRSSPQVSEQTNWYHTSSDTSSHSSTAGKGNSIIHDKPSPGRN